MIDSIDFLISDIYFIDFNYLKSIGINDIKPFTKTDRLGNEYVNYRWSYKNVEFKYNTVAKKITAITNAHTILDGKMDITLSDKAEYEARIATIFNEVFAGIPAKYELDRIDYCVDVKFENEEVLNKYLLLYESQNLKFARMSKKLSYATSIHRSSKRGQYNLNIYNKYEETRDERYRGVLRLELQMKRPKIVKEYKINGILRELDNYWTKNAMEEYYFKFLTVFFGIGKHMKYFKAKEIINHSDYSDIWKKKLKSFLKKRMAQIDCKGIVKSRTTVNTYTQKLAELGVNTLCMFEAFEPFFPNEDGLDNLLDLAKAVAKEKYFK